MTNEQFLEVTVMTVPQCKFMGQVLMTLGNNIGLDLEQLEDDIDLACNVTKEELEYQSFQRAMSHIRSDYRLYL
jgi:hypothetical protein